MGPSFRRGRLGSFRGARGRRHLGEVLRDAFGAKRAEGRENAAAGDSVEPAGTVHCENRHVGVVDLAKPFLELRRGVAESREIGGERFAEELGGVAELLVGDAQVVERDAVVRGSVAPGFDAASGAIDRARGAPGA
jgi:hypothetical protein